MSEPAKTRKVMVRNEPVSTRTKKPVVLQLGEEEEFWDMIKIAGSWVLGIHSPKFGSDQLSG